MNRWINADKRRCDQVDLVRDLFGWTLILAWGGLESRRRWIIDIKMRTS
jgi:hypothetical protein